MKKQNIQAEIEFFDKIAEYDDSFSETEYKKIFDKTGSHFNGRILEAGCSSGPFGPKIKSLKKDIDITGVDINQKFISMAEKRKVYNKLLCADLEKKDLFEKSEFDTIFCPFVIHHFPDIQNVIENFSFWLKPGGYLIIADPNGSNLILRMSYFLRIVLSKILSNIKNYASINESHKSISLFKRYLKRDYEICLIETFDRELNPGPNSSFFSIINMLTLFRKILLTIYKKIPFIKYRGSDIIIIAKKN